MQSCIGQQKIHTELIQEPVPILDTGGEQDTQTFISLLNVDGDPLADPSDPAFFPRRNDNTTREGIFPSMLSDFQGFDFDYIRYLNNHDVFCELWIAKCPLVC